MTARRLQAATINRRLAALRSLVKLATTLGLVSWTLAVENLKAQAYRDTRGPSLDAYKALLVVAPAERGSARGPTLQCGARPYSFAVHGLWPQYEKGFPEYCQVPAPRLYRGPPKARYAS
jgi:ribonuclease I